MVHVYLVIQTQVKVLTDPSKQYQWLVYARESKSKKQMGSRIKQTWSHLICLLWLFYWSLLCWHRDRLLLVVHSTVYGFWYHHQWYWGTRCFNLKAMSGTYTQSQKKCTRNSLAALVTQGRSADISGVYHPITLRKKWYRNSTLRSTTWLSITWYP